MLQRRTDLAVEAQELRAQAAQGPMEGVEMAQGAREGYPVTLVRVTSARGAEELGKPVGTYVTLELAGLKRREADAFPRAARALCAELRGLLPLKPGEGVLVVGLGNRAITPDNIGPEAARHTLATRHLTAQVPEHFGHLRPVCVLCTGVLAQTGMESGELVRAAVDALRPACVLAIDALTSRSLQRVCSTVQLSDTGITPGSGVGNHRAALDRETLGVPVIAIGAPTVVDVATLCADVLAEAGKGDLEPEALRGAAPGLLVTPRDIDQSAADLAKVIGFGVNLALQDSLCLEDIELLLS
jgi:spore protease